MKFEIAHEFRGITPAEYERLYFDEEFTTKLSDAVQVARTVTHIDRTSERVVRHQRCEPVRDIPPAIQRILGDRKVGYFEELDFAFGEGRGVWRVTPTVAAEKVTATGTLHVEPAVGGARRTFRGDISVAVFGIGGLIERFVVGEMQKSYDDAAAFTRAFLAKRAG